MAGLEAVCFWAKKKLKSEIPAYVPWHPLVRVHINKSQLA